MIMRTAPTSGATSLRFTAILLAASLVVAACVPVQQAPRQYQAPASAPRLGRSDLPVYSVGTTYVYSNGSWERVAEKHPSYLIWENERGERLLSSPDFTYRPAKWESKNIKGYRSFAPTEYLYSSTRTSIWPLITGNRTNFDEKSRWGVPGVYEKHAEATWKCSVEGTQKVAVPAGSFDTYKITCSRYSKITRAKKAKLWEDKTFYYAPTVGHWVLMEQDFFGASPNVRRELVAILPSLSALGVDKTAAVGIKEHFQQTLGTAPSGEMERWTDDSGKISFAMTPIATYRLGDGTPCRQYEQRLDLGWQSASYYGIACRGESGLWAVPRR